MFTASPRWSFVKGKLTVLATACDRHLGGRDFDNILADHFAAEWKEKHKIDALTNKKAMYRLLVACEKQKKILSANPKAPVSIECFMDDIDVNGMAEREMVEEATAAPQQHWFGPSGDPRSAGIHTPEAIKLCWSSHREIIYDYGPVAKDWVAKQS